MSHPELLAQYTETGWLRLPPSNPLRRIAERSLERALEPTPGPGGGRGGPAGAISLAGIVLGSRG